MWKLARKVDQASGWGEVVAAGTDGSHLCNTHVTDLKPGVMRGQMGHPSTHVLGGTYAEPKDHTSPTLASSVHTDRITATCQGTLALCLSFSLHLGLSAHLAGDNDWRWAGPGSWAQSPGWGSRPGPDIRRPRVLA